MRFVKSPYFSSRGNNNISLIVIHTCVGYYESTIKYFESNSLKVSAHYVLKEDGSEVCQMVDEINAAHHAGNVYEPNPKYYKNTNPNFYSIGIECADNNKPSEWNRDGQYLALAILVRDICKRYNLPIDRDHVCGHHELYSKKSCPGNLNVDKIVKLAKEGDFEMNDDTKNALGELEKAKAEFAFGNLESTVRGLIASQRDIVKIKAELEEYKNGEPICLKNAVDTAIVENNKNWQSLLDTANKKVEILNTKVDQLISNQAENLSIVTLFQLLIKKLGFKTGGDNNEV